MKNENYLLKFILVKKTCPEPQNSKKNPPLFSQRKKGRTHQEWW